jgi:hypothetical protein
MASVGTAAGDDVAGTLDVDDVGGALAGGVALGAGLGLLAGAQAVTARNIAIRNTQSRAIPVSLARRSRAPCRTLGFPAREGSGGGRTVPVVADPVARVAALAEGREIEEDQAAQDRDDDGEEFHVDLHGCRGFVEFVGTMMTSHWSSDKVRFDGQNEDQIPD